LLPAVTGLISGLAFLNNSLGALVLVGLLPFVWYTRQYTSLSLRQIFFDCWRGAFVFTLIAGAWTLQTEPSNWLGIIGTTATFVKITTWILIAAWSSLSMAIILGLCTYWARSKQVLLLVLLPFAWALAELVRSYSLALFFIGPGSSLSPNWNFGALGLAMTATPFAFLGRFVGLYGLSAVAVVINIAIYLTIIKRFKLAVSVMGVVLVLNFVAWRLYAPSSNHYLHVVAVYLHNDGGSLNPWGSIDLPPKDTDVLALPEYSHFFENPHYQEFAEANFADNTAIVTTQVSKGASPVSNNLTYYSNRTGFVSVQSKTFLAPYGEYLPYSATELLKAVGQQAALTRFRHDDQVRKGKKPEQVVTVNGIKIGGLACSGVLNLNEYRRLAHEGADVLTNSASLSLLETAGLYRVQEMYQNRFHAIANAKPFVQSARSGEAYIISSDGHVIASASDKSRLLEATVPVQSKRTVYSWLP